MKKLLLATMALAVLLGTAATPREDSIVLDGAGDSYVVADLADQEDAQALRDKNFGNLEFIKVWYVNQVRAQEQVYSVGLVKFDLSQLQDKEIHSAQLQLFALRADLAQPARLVDVSLADDTWNETEINFKSLPSVSQQPIATTAVYGAGVWYSWDVSGAVARKAADGKVAFAVGLRTVEQKKEEQVVFASREVARAAPRLVATYAPPASPILPNVSFLNAPIVIIYVWQVVGVLVLALLLAGGAAGGLFLVNRRGGVFPALKPAVGKAAPLTSDTLDTAISGVPGEPTDANRSPRPSVAPGPRSRTAPSRPHLTQPRGTEDTSPGPSAS